MQQVCYWLHILATQHLNRTPAQLKSRFLCYTNLILAQAIAPTTALAVVTCPCQTGPSSTWCLAFGPVPLLVYLVLLGGDSVREGQQDEVRCRFIHGELVNEQPGCEAEPPIRGKYSVTFPNTSTAHRGCGLDSGWLLDGKRE